MFLFRREAFTLIVFVQLLSLAIWCRSLLIMIISKSLSCIVHLCNSIFSRQCSRRTPARPPLPLLCTGACSTHLLRRDIKSILFRNLSNFGVSLRQETEEQKRRPTLLISSIKMSLCVNFIMVEFAEQEQRTR